MKKIALIVLTVIALCHAENPFEYLSERAIKSVGKCSIAADSIIGDLKGIEFKCKNGNVHLTIKIKDGDRIARLHISYKIKSNTKHFCVSNDFLTKGSSCSTWEYDEFGIRLKERTCAMKITQHDIDELWEKIKRISIVKTETENGDDYEN